VIFHRLLLPSAALACLAATSLPAATPDDPGAHLDFLKGRLVEKLHQFDKRLAGPNADPSVRDLPSAALVELYLGDNPAAAEALLQHMFKLQNMDAASPEFGMVPWQEGHPEIKDGNSVDFTMMPFAQIMRRFGDRLSPEFKQEAAPHLKAAIAGVRFRNAAVSYTNIFLMQATSLLLLGEAANDDSAVAEAVRQFDAWIDLTRQEGITEYDSPTYTPVQIGDLQIAYDNTSHAELKPRLKACLDYFWSDLAANYYAPHQSLSGPESRVYDFLFGDKNIDQVYFLAGLRSAIPGETLLSDEARIWTDAATPGGYRPSQSILDLANAPTRTVLLRQGTRPGPVQLSDALLRARDRQFLLRLAGQANLPGVRHLEGVALYRGRSRWLRRPLR
jgi:hypothetical protein